MTKLEYLHNSSLHLSAKVQGLSNDDQGSYLLVDRTIFYPQGGGQPADKGFIKFPPDFQVEIYSVKYFNGEVRHYGDFSKLDLCEGLEVDLFVDEGWRVQNSKAHTAGHLLHAVIESMDCDLTAVKGYHFPDSPYVEFAGSKPEKPELFIEETNRRLQSSVSSGLTVSCSVMSFEKLIKECKIIPEGLPMDKPLRVAVIQGSDPVPCGGIHVKDLSEFKEVFVSKLKCKRGKVRLSYKFS